MESSAASWWGTIWYLWLTVGFFSTFAFGIILLTLPPAYSHFHPRELTEAAFSATHKKDPKKSGYHYFTQHKNPNGVLQFPTSVQIVVLGDIGRSPRMQYHALSIASHGGLVDLIGYTGSEIHPDILRSAFVTIVPLRTWPSALQPSNRLLFLLVAPFKVLFQLGTLYLALNYRTRASKWLLVQNPPSIPTLLMAQIASYLRDTRLVIDWHNFGHSILALRLGAAHPLVLVARGYEYLFSRKAAAHFCVSDAMARVLRDDWGVRALPLHDRPAEIFQPLSPGARTAFLARLPETAEYAEAMERGDCRLLVSSTSWTADEDFSLLIEALVEYAAAGGGTTDDNEEGVTDGTARARRKGRPLPRILAIITGRGPLREYYLARIEALTSAGKLPNVEVKTAWLSPADYASLLGAADLGVSLHTSSSGVDLPMKVVDMFGAGLPVAGWKKFEAWGELVKESVNGKGFESAGQLAKILQELFGGDGKELAGLREGAIKEGQRRWEDEWMPVAGKLFQLKG